ncbi:MAG: carboxypeptidase-like regulatory domain-containing protein, partial [Chitinophagaceae bacterium]
MKGFFVALCLLYILPASSQKLYGTVFTEMGDLLPFSSITIKGSTRGASANEKARFAFTVPNGTYTVVCQHIGYLTQEKQITVNGDTEISFALKAQELQMGEVVVKTGDQDPAYEIIRQAIKKREYHSKQVKAFEVDIYTKDMIKMRNLPNRIFGQKIPDEDRKQMGLDSTGQGIIYLSESLAKIYSQQPDKFKMDVSSSRVSGSGGFGFTFPAFISLYNNNVKVFTDRINPRGFVSPIADGAIGFYKFKFLGTFWEDGKAVNSIRVTPRRTYEPLFSGIINITDDDWRIFSFDLQLTKTAQLELLDTLK